MPILPNELRRGWKSWTTAKITGLLERFWRKVVVRPWDCWEWQGYRDKGGYGHFDVFGKNQLAHRVSYTHFAGEITDGMGLDHLCRNRRCVNPEHLEQVTNVVNIKRGWHAQKTRCKNGHVFSPENTYTTREGHRNCRRCNADAAKRHKVRKSRRNYP